MNPGSPSESENEDNFQVYARIRPPAPREVNIIENSQNTRPDIKYSSEHFPVYASIDPPSCLLKTTDNLIYFYDPLSSRRDKPFVFDGVYNETMNNREVFQRCVMPNLENLFQGFNTTFFAYGNTGSGKTHTIFGNNEEKGIFLMAFEEILERIKNMKNRSFLMNFSYLEIYNENVRDLLSETQKSLSMVEDPIKGVYVPELKQNAIFSLEQIVHQIAIGNQKRALAATFSNQYSSRSHALLQLVIETKTFNKTQANEENCISKLTVVDLAGSEKAFISLDNKSKGILEGSNINKSLLALGNCINILSEKAKKAGHVPYRDSKLTRLLKDSLGGNTKTIMIACISPSLSCMEETLNTLNYAKRARNIKKKVYRNIKENADDYENKYKEQIQNLLQKIDFLNNIISQPSFCQICKKLIKENQDHNKFHKETTKYSDPIKKYDNLSCDEISGAHKAKNNKIIQEKIDLMRSIKNLEDQLLELKQENSERLTTSGGNSPEYFKRICKDVMANIEENLEIKQSLKELDDLILQNNTNLKILNERLGSLEEQLYENEELEEEIAMIKKNNLENVEIKNKLFSALNVNQTQKNILFELMLKISDENKAIVLEKEISCKRKQLEVFDVLVQNNDFSKELQLKEKIILEKDALISSLRRDFRESKTTVNSDNSPVVFKNLPDLNSKRNNSSTLSNNNLLTPPQVEPQKYFGLPSYALLKSPKTDIIKKNKSDCYTNLEGNPKESTNNVCESQLTIKKAENQRSNRIFNQDSYKSPYKIAEPEILNVKVNKENIHPSPYTTNQSEYKSNETEKMKISNYLQQNKILKKSPIVTKIELFSLVDENKTEDPVLKSPKDVFQKSSLEKLKRRTTSTSKRYEEGEDQIHSNIILNEFNMNAEEMPKSKALEYFEIKKENDAVLFDSLNCLNENPLNSQSLNKFQPFVDFADFRKEDTIIENNKTAKQSFEDFRAKFLGQNKVSESPIPLNEFIKIKQENLRHEKNIDSFKNFDESSIKLPGPSFHKNNFDSANKNPMESESENDTEKNMVGSPIIQKSSRNYYTNSKIIPNMHNRGTFKINDL